MIDETDLEIAFEPYTESYEAIDKYLCWVGRSQD
jgi:hypothetical protein